MDFMDVYINDEQIFTRIQHTSFYMYVTRTPFVNKQRLGFYFYLTPPYIRFALWTEIWYIFDVRQVFNEDSLLIYASLIN